MTAVTCYMKAKKRESQRSRGSSNPGSSARDASAEPSVETTVVTHHAGSRQRGGGGGGRRRSACCSKGTTGSQQFSGCLTNGSVDLRGRTTHKWGGGVPFWETSKWRRPSLVEQWRQPPYKCPKTKEQRCVVHVLFAFLPLFKVVLLARPASQSHPDHIPLPSWDVTWHPVD